MAEFTVAPTRVLVVAHKTAATQPLLDAVRERAARGPCSFTLLVPNPAHGLHKVVDAEDQGAGEAQSVIAKALPSLSDAAGSQVDGVVGDPDPTAAVQDAINLRGFDEVIVSTLSPRLSRWLKLDLPSKISGMGLPVTTVTPADEPDEEPARHLSAS
jgi:cell pole-organizing protein PopZ